MNPTSVMQLPSEGVADLIVLRHEVDQLKQKVDSVVDELWNLKKKKVWQCKNQIIGTGRLEWIFLL